MSYGKLFKEKKPTMHSNLPIGLLLIGALFASATAFAQPAAPATAAKIQPSPFRWGCTGARAPCVMVRFEGREYETEYYRQINNQNLPIDTYYYPLLENGRPVFYNGEQLWERFARVPSSDYPDQSNARMYHVTKVRQGNAWVERERPGVRFEAAGGAGRSAEAAGRALFEQALAQRNLQPGGGQATQRPFEVGPKHELPPGRKVYIAWRRCTMSAGDVARAFPGRFYRIEEGEGPYSYTDFVKLGPFPLEEAERLVAAWGNDLNRARCAADDPPARRPTDGYGPRLERGITDPYGQQMK